MLALPAKFVPRENAMSVRLFLLVPVVALLLALLPPAAECQTIYRYKDAHGNICFTDNLKSIPKDAVLSSPPAGEAPSSAPIPKDSPSAPAPVVAPAVAPPSAAAGAVAMAHDYWQKSWVQCGAFMAGAFVVLLFLLKFLEHLPSRNLGRLILLIFFLGTATFGYKLFVEGMLQRYAAAKEATTKVVDEVNKRQEARQGDLLPARE
jgi:hypothetical protein